MSDKKYATFKLCKEKYGIDIQNVSEISEYTEIIKIPNTPDYVIGVIKVRDEIVPIVSLKKRLHIGEDQIGDKTRIIISYVRERKIGFIVDETSEVISTKDQNIMNDCDEIMLHNNEYINGFITSEDDLITILDLGKLLS